MTHPPAPREFQVCVCTCPQSCLALCNSMNCSPPGSSVHGIFQARILEWVAISFSIDCMDHSKLWKMLKELGVPDHLNCLLRNLYVGQEATVRTRQGTTDWLKIGKGVQTRQCIVTCLFNLYAEYLMQNAGLDGREK